MSRGLRWFSVVVVMALIGVGLAVALHRTDSTADRLDASQSDRNALKKQLDAQQKTSQTLAAQIKSLGKTPVVEPKASNDKVPVLLRGPRGLRGPTGAKGAPGSPGKPGTSGLPGKSGANGTDGKSGPAGPAGADGLDGKPGADGINGVDGKPGADGKNGTDGKDGRGITSVTCTGLPTMTLDITYSDGSTETVTCGRR